MPTTSSQSEEPCGCGSGKTKVQCHGPILEAPLLRKVPVAQEIYVREWSVNAEHYRSQGLYEILAAELMASADVHRLLDVGCGLGQGLEALNRRLPEESGSLLVGIDENPVFISGSAARLDVAPREVSNHRLKSRKTLSGYLDSEVSTSGLKSDGRVVLVNADLMVADPSLDRL